MKASIWRYTEDETGLGPVLFAFLKASVLSRDSMRASIPFSVPRTSIMTQSLEGAHRVSRSFSKLGHEATMCSRVCISSPHEQDGSSTGTKDE